MHDRVGRPHQTFMTVLLSPQQRPVAVRPEQQQLSAFQQCLFLPFSFISSLLCPLCPFFALFSFAFFSTFFFFLAVSLPVARFCHSDSKLRKEKKENPLNVQSNSRQLRIPACPNEDVATRSCCKKFVCKKKKTKQKQVLLYICTGEGCTGCNGNIPLCLPQC